jgi:hypothetical protein
MAALGTAEGGFTAYNLIWLKVLHQDSAPRICALRISIGTDFLRHHHSLAAPAGLRNFPKSHDAAHCKTLWHAHTPLPSVMKI